MVYKSFDSKNREYMQESDVRYYKNAKIDLRTNEILFDENEGAILQVQLKNKNSKNNKFKKIYFTPNFGDYYAYTNLFNYINEVWCLKNKVNKSDINLNVSYQKLFLFRVDPETLEPQQLLMSDLEPTFKNYSWNDKEWFRG